MDDDKISTFLTMSETLNFTKSAEMLHKSQAVVSRQISAIEEELGLQLFERGSHSCSLTPGGAHLAKGLRRISDEYQKLIDDSRMYQLGISGRLSIGVHSGELGGQYKKVLKDFEKLYPNIEIVFEDYRLNELESRLESGNIDLAQLVLSSYWYAQHRKQCCHINSGTWHICLYVHKSHPLYNADSSELSLKSFKNDPFIVFSDNEPDYANGRTVSLLRNAGIEPTVRPCRTLASAIIMLEAGSGVLLASNHLTIAPDSSYRKLFFPGLGTENEILAWNTSNTNPCINMFTSFLKKAIERDSTILTEDPYFEKQF